MNPLLHAMLRNAVGLALFACVTVGVIAVTEVATRDAIAEQQREARRRALLEILPASSFDNAILDDAVSVADPRLGQDAAVQALIARRDGTPVAAVVPLRVADGYSGAIRLIVAIRPDGTLAGVRVVEHRETPGLGDAIEARKSDWIESFRGRALGDPPASQWTVRKDGGAFDAFTGATITPRAVVRGVYRTLDWFADAGRAQLFPATVTPAQEPGAAGGTAGATGAQASRRGTIGGARTTAIAPHGGGEA
ncbi:MAG TPA: electron transport complex subunit RsxG [Pseudomonadales bacterium]|nr:electron transport complex subunit RsxG [Pseudomonadales bacterium]